MAQSSDTIYFILGASCSVIIAIMLLDFMRNEYKYNKYGFKFWKASSDVFLSLFIFILYLMFAIHTTIDRLYAIIIYETNDSFDAHWCISYFMELVTFTTPKILLYIFFILRLHSVFKNSSFAVSKISLKVIAVIVAVPLILNAIVGVINALKPIQHFLHHQKHDSNINIHHFDSCGILTKYYKSSTMLLIQYIAITLYLLGELIYSVTILRLFLSRILMLSMSYEKMKIRMERTSSKSKQKMSKEASVVISQSVPATTHTIPKSIEESRSKSSQQIETKNHEVFLHLAIKTANLIILVICSNYLILFKFGTKIATSILNINVLCNCFAVYLSYRFSDKYYDLIFKPCHTLCYGCCVRLCYCCCLPTKLPDHVELEKEHKTVENGATTSAANIV
eukprot:525288_1